MTYDDWKHFMTELRQVGQGEVADKFEEAEREVDLEMADRAARAKQMIENANTAQIVQEAVKEGRLIYYSNAKGEKILH